METTQVTVTKTWSKISDGNCTIQSQSPSNIYEFAVGASTPVNASLSLMISQPVNFAYGNPVWCRLAVSSDSSKNSAVLNVIK